MGMFFVARGPRRERVAAAALRTGEELGFSHPRMLAAGETTIYVYPKRGQDKANALAFENGDFIAACGSFIYRGRTGEEALRLFHDAFDGSAAPFRDTICNFAVVVRKGGRIHIAGDAGGGYHIFRDGAAHMVSSSFLVAASALERATLLTQAVYEYVFNGVISGGDTLVNEISLVPIGGSIVIEGDEARLIQPLLEPPHASSSLSRAELMEQSLGELDNAFRTIVRAFGDKITCALSGGHDSRLILAMLMRCGCVPRVYVYGHPSDPDVMVATRIAASEGFALETRDKDASAIIPPERFAAQVRQNYRASDGYVWSGIFNNGAEEEERARRVAAGAIALNGGGGEIFRNFFYLPNRRYTLREILWSFYAQFDPRACTPLFIAERYFRDLERKLLELVGVAGPLERATVEWLYHRFRCRAWDGRIDTINAQYGFTGLPFQHPPITQLGASIPIRWKNYGAFELELIRRANRRLASYPSAYGYNFASPPPLSARAKALATYLRPPWLRRLTHRIKHRWRADDDPRYRAADYVKEVLPGGIDSMRAFFRIDRIKDPSQMARILSLEYLVCQFGAKLRFEAE